MATSHDAEKAPPTNAERPLDTSPSPFRDLSDKALARDDDSKEDIAYSLGIDQSVPVLPSWARWVPFQWNRATAWSGLNVNGKKLIRCVELFAGLAILFFGYDQGVRSGVNESPHYRNMVGIEADTSRNKAAEGGIVAIYYGGTLIGGLIAGSFADKVGRLPTIGVAALVAIVGAVLQTGAQDITSMMIGRVVTGFGTGALNVAVPVLSAEMSTHTRRGAALSFEFFLNIVGLSCAYWIEYALRSTQEQLRYRLPLATQLVFLFALLAILPFFPESPRYLAHMGRWDEARYVLARLRTENADETDPEVLKELEGIREVIAVERREATHSGYWTLLTEKDRYNVRRRAWLSIQLQILQELSGVGLVTVYAPTVFRQAGFSSQKSALLSGINDLTYAAAVWVAVLTIDTWGRRMILYVGAIIMGFSLIICGIGARFVADDLVSDEAKFKWACTVAFGIFLYTACFGATWLVPPWLYPTEIMPLHVRAKGSGFSVAGWSVGNGSVMMIGPYLFKAIGYWTFILFAVFNFLNLPFVWALYPETAGCSLEEMDILFTSSIWVWRAKAEIRDLAEADPELFEAAQHGDTAAMELRRRVRRQHSQESMHAGVPGGV